jgi:hypothetical protein
VLTHDKSLRDGATVAIKELLLRYTATDLYESEEVRSACVYPASYYVLPVEAQVTKLMALFPNLKTVNEKLGRKTYSEEAEGWFVIPRWNALAPTYNEAVASLVSLDCVTAVLLCAAHVQLWRATSLGWGYSRSPVCSLPIPSGCLRGAA